MRWRSCRRQRRLNLRENSRHQNSSDPRSQNRDLGHPAEDLAAARKLSGRRGEPRDIMIAGIVLASHAKLATRNVKHFEDIAASVVNPWEPKGSESFGASG